MATGTKKLSKFFQDYLQEDSLFTDKAHLLANYQPDTVEHRDDQLSQLADILAPALKNHKPSNVFIYGKTGTGKTTTVNVLTQQMQDVAKENNIPLNVCYVNCKLKRVADTEYRLIAEITRHFGKAIPPTGLPTDEVYKIFYQSLEETPQVVLLVLDEIDQLVNKCGDEILYNLTRIGTQIQNTQLAIVGISNDLLFTEHLDPRVVSSLSEEEIVFPPYNALQLKEILYNRSQEAFKENAVQQGVIEKCAAYAAKEHGDARRAIELLRIAGELAERSKKEQITMEHIDEAEDKIERDKVVTLINTQPKQQQALLLAIMKVLESSKTKTTLTGQAYEYYEKLCVQTALRPLTQRRASDIISEFDMLGIINANVISKGRGGRTREITLTIPQYVRPKVEQLLISALGLQEE